MERSPQKLLQAPFDLDFEALTPGTACTDAMNETTERGYQLGALCRLFIVERLAHRRNVCQTSCSTIEVLSALKSCDLVMRHASHEQVHNLIQFALYLTHPTFKSTNCGMRCSTIRAPLEKLYLQIQQCRLSEIPRHVLRVECMRCFCIVEIQKLGAIKYHGPYAVWKDVGQRLQIRPAPTAQADTKKMLAGLEKLIVLLGGLTEPFTSSCRANRIAEATFDVFVSLLQVLI